jgi:hypothetical protein
MRIKLEIACSRWGHQRGELLPTEMVLWHSHKRFYQVLHMLQGKEGTLARQGLGHA